MSITYIRFHAACKAQGLDRKTLVSRPQPHPCYPADSPEQPYTGYLQPFCGWFGLIWFTLVTIFYGYPSFRPAFSVTTFFQNYIMQILDPILFIGWKIVHKTKWLSVYEVDLVWERPTIGKHSSIPDPTTPRSLHSSTDAYEETFIDPPVGFWREMGQLVGIKTMKGGNDKRRGSAIQN